MIDRRPSHAGRSLSRRVSTRWTAGAALLLLFAGVAAAALTMNQRPAIGAEPVVYVDGYPITRAAFDAYAGVFTDPGGQLQVSRGEVLMSLINQELVSREAERLGVEVDEAAVDEAMEQSMSIGVTRRSLESSGGMEGLRARFEAFFELKQVKAAVVGKVTISDNQLQLAYEWDPGLQGVTLAEAADVLRERLTVAEGERRWSEWLARQRACASIRVVDSSLGLASSTISADCG